MISAIPKWLIQVQNEYFVPTALRIQRLIGVLHISRASGTFTYPESGAPEGQNICRNAKYAKETVRAAMLFKVKTIFRTPASRRQGILPGDKLCKDLKYCQILAVFYLKIHDL